MSLQEWWKYETIWHHKVHIKWSFDFEEMLLQYEDELSKILRIWKKSPEEREKILQEHNVVYGITDYTNIMPSATRHAQTGKCLWGNTGWVMGNWATLKKKLKDFDIDIESK